MLRTLNSFISDVEDRLSLRLQIGIATALSGIVIAAALAASAAYMSSRTLEAMTTERMQVSARKMADQLDRYMYERFREVQLLASLGDTYGQWTASAEDKRNLLEQLQASVPQYSWLGIADSAGVVQASTDGLLEGVSVAKRNWFQNGLEAPVVEDVHEAVLLAKLLEAPADGGLLRFVDVAVPIHDRAGMTIGVLGAHINWNWSEEIRQGALVPDPDGGATDYLILSKTGEVLQGEGVGTSPLSAAELAAINGSPTGAFRGDMGGTEYLTGFAATEGYQTYRSPGWVVVARRPAAEALAPATNLGWTILGLGALAALSGVAVAFWTAHRASRSVNDLTAAADRVGRDPGATMIPHMRGSLEMTTLATALRSLLRRVGVAEEKSRAAERREHEHADQLADDLRQLRRMADTDPLSGLPNRRAFLHLAQDAMNYFRRYNRPIACLIVDIDHFKRVNDTFGHSTGDAVIKQVAEIVSAAIRETDKAARFGGEEFVILLREIDQEGAIALAERIRRTVEQSPTHRNNSEVAITVSIGLALAVANDRDFDDVIERADKSLYIAKNTGRNRVACLTALAVDDSRRVA